MGWGVLDYPSAPREPLAACTRGCELLGDCQLYRCTQKACGQEELCVGCIWQCADCGDDFCEDHIENIAPDGARYALYLCRSCRATELEEAA
jgi:hypothetical protein